jgi:hypothetical protein
MTRHTHANKAHGALEAISPPVPITPVMFLISGHRIPIGRLWSFSTRNCFQRLAAACATACAALLCALLTLKRLGSIMNLTKSQKVKSHSSQSERLNLD